MTEPNDQPAKPRRTWRPRALGTACVLLALGLATTLAVLAARRETGRSPEAAVRPPAARDMAAGPVHSELAAIENCAVVCSSEQELTVWNYNSGKGGTMPDIINTLRWYDGGERRDWTVDTETLCLGWVEGIATFETAAGKVYVLVSEQKRATACYATCLTALRIGKGQSTLQEVQGFFPDLPGASGDGSSVEWEYCRKRGVDVFPRPFEVRIDGQRQCLTIWVFPEASTGNASAATGVEQQEFELTLADGKLVCRGLDEAGREAIRAVTGVR